MQNKISSMLDSIADRLEAKGLLKEAYELDKVADAVEAAEMHDPTYEVTQWLKPTEVQQKKQMLRQQGISPTEMFVTDTGELYRKGPAPSPQKGPALVRKVKPGMGHKMEEMDPKMELKE